MGTGLVLIADGDRGSAARMEQSLRGAHHEVLVTHDGVTAISELHGAEFDVIVLDLDLGGRRAFDVIAAARHLSPDSEVIVVAENAELAAAVECIRLGIFDLLDKKSDLTGDALPLTVARAIERRRLRAVTTLFRASQEILASSDAERLPATIVDIAARVLEADDVALSVPGTGGRMRVLHATSVSDEMRALASEEVGATLAERVSELGVAVLLPEDSAKVGRDRTRGSRVHSAIIFPLTSGERRVGTLTLSRAFDPRPYRRTDIERASVLASQALLAVENAQLARRSLEAERLATIGQLAAGVAHEINNPLTYIIASGTDARDAVQELLAAANDASAEAAQKRTASLLLVADALSDVCDGGQRIAEIARDLRTLARGNAPVRELLDLGEAIRSAARIAGPRVRETALLDLDLAEGTRVSGHAGRLTQVFVNLVVNAAQAGGSAERPVHITVRTHVAAEQILTTVRDDGPGIAPEHLDLLFQPFFSTKSSGSGTGLGLSLTQSIVAEHGGTISVSSEVGRGATFTLLLPLAAPAPVTHPGSSEDSGMFRRPPRVVFIHPDKNALRACARWFGRSYDVSTFETVASARALLVDRADIAAVVCESALVGELMRDVGGARPGLRGRLVVPSDGLDYQALRTALAETLALAA